MRSTPGLPSLLEDNNQLENKAVPPTLCLVCGDKATGYHYEISSCNGCKSFFRRTIVDQRTFKCKQKKACFVNPGKGDGKRQTCRSCRMQKCIDVGMNPRALLGLEGTMNTMLDKMLRTKHTNQKMISINSQIPKQPITTDVIQTKYLIGLERVEDAFDRFRKSSYNPDPYHLPTLDRLVEGNCQFGIAEQFGCIPCSSDEQCWSLDHYSRAQKLFETGMPPEHDAKRKHWIVFDMLSTVEYAKTYPFFQELTNSDKTLLLKAVCMKCVNLFQAFFSYKNNSDVIMNPDGSRVYAKGSHYKWRVKDISTTFGLSSDDITLYDCPFSVNNLIRAKGRALEPLFRIGITRKEFILLKAILLCNAEALDLSPYGMAVVLREKSKFASFLLNLCLAEHGSKGAARFADILSIQILLENIVNEQRNFLTLYHLRFPNGKRGLSVYDQIVENYT